MGDGLVWREYPYKHSSISMDLLLSQEYEKLFFFTY